MTSQGSHETLILGCLIQGEDGISDVSVDLKIKITTLKEVICEKGKLDYAPRTIKLWKVSIRDDEHLNQELNGLELKESDKVERLKDTQLLNKSFGSNPPEPEHLHIIVQPSRACSAYVKEPHPTFVKYGFDVRFTLWADTHYANKDDYISRKSTIKALYERLRRYRFVRVRGTPGSGKTALAILLERYITDHEPYTKVFCIPSWHQIEEAGGWQAWQKSVGFKHRSVALLDEAQVSYRDEEFWLKTVKMIEPSYIYDLNPPINKFILRIIVFVNYGSPSLRVSPYTPLIVPDNKRVTLHQVDRKDGIPPVALYLTESEFEELVLVRYPNNAFHRSLLDFIFKQTQGHVGAVTDWLHLLYGHVSFRMRRQLLNEVSYSLDVFQQHVPPHEFFHMICGGASVFTRGLPQREDLQSPLWLMSSVSS
ncbi:hypothetical protein FRC02_008656 [Tulasnella sp. 418]|nr:hypothetical protein FRC02_008656 [Tulasnella sp. 418]